MDTWPWLSHLVPDGPTKPPVVSVRTLREALEAALMDGYTRAQLETVLPDELDLVPQAEDWQRTDTKRQLIDSFIGGWSVPQLAALARRVTTQCEIPTDKLTALLAAYDRQTGGVAGTVKNLIFAADGPKPELVLRDAVSNDIEIVRNTEFCLVYDRTIPPEGLTFSALIDWWRASRRARGDDQAVGRDLWGRLLRSLKDNGAEREVFRAYGRRYSQHGYDIPALIPQVYLHYDPYSTTARGPGGSPLQRQRMDFLLLYSDRRRVVIEVDGRQHYADQAGRADPRRYAQLVAEDRRLRLDGYEVYRIGGQELVARRAAEEMLAEFFDQLHDRHP